VVNSPELLALVQHLLGQQRVLSLEAVLAHCGLVYCVEDLWDSAGMPGTNKFPR